VLLSLQAAIIAAESPSIHDTTYYSTYANQLTSRLYLSRKYTSLAIDRITSLSDIKFQPNTTTNFGIGTTYKNFTLNLAYGFGFLNPDVGRGKTQYLDLQAHMFPRKYAIDLFGQFYNGFYQRIQNHNQGERYELRPDLHLRKFGLSFHYIFNHRRFSYRALVFHSEWQKKSAGSFLLGFDTFAGYFRADSAIHMHQGLRNTSYTRFLNIGPSAGYAYTLVIKKHFYISTSLVASPGYAYSSYVDQPEVSGNHTVNINGSLRVFAGYNSKKWAIGFFYVDHIIFFPGASAPFKYSINTGNLRINLIRRIIPGAKLTKHLRPVDKILDLGKKP
jgi:hypothetical protein